MAELKITEEQFLHLFDSNWFNHKIFQNPKNPYPQNQKISKETNTSQFPPTLKIRSLSDHLILTSIPIFPPKSLSPKAPKLQTIHSGKQIEDQFEEPEAKKKVISEKKEGKKQSKKQGNSKSLSDLEFEELKGFMDLGFVFSEKDKEYSNLVSIIPGLNRLGKEDDEGRMMKESEIARPYLSEAWMNLDDNKRKRMTELMNWRMPVMGNEMYVKDQLRFWAHTVASTVK